MNKLHDDDKYLLKKTHPNNSSHNIYYSLNNKTEIFKKLATEFIENSYWLEFYSSAYCQNMIHAEFVKSIKSKWNYPDDKSIRQNYRTVLDYRQQKGECLEINTEKCLEMANKHIKGVEPRLFGDQVPFPYLSDDELLFILKKSSSAFKFAFNVLIPTDEVLSKLREDDLLFTSCSFFWENVPGQDSNKIIKFLEAEGVDWVENAEIEKNSDNKVMISNGKKSLFFELKKGKNKIKINEKSYILHSKEVGEGCMVANFFQTDPDTLHNNTLIKIWNQLPKFLKERYSNPINTLIPNKLFLEQIILNFILDVRLGNFVAQPPHSTVLKVGLNVQMSLNGKEMIHKDISYETSQS